MCPNCGEPHYISEQIPKKAQKSVAYFSVIDSLRMHYKDSLRAKILQYRHKYISREDYKSENSIIGNIFDGNQYKSLVALGLFTDLCDIALIASTDGYQLFKKKQYDCWIILLLNANLPPDQRVKKENLMITAIISGSKSPKNFNSFLQPLVDELKCLEARHVYFPLSLPKGYNGKIYNPNKLLMHSHTSYLQNIKVLENKKRETGLNGHSVLFELRSISFPASFPIDIMHSLFENIAQHMFRHFNGKFFSNEKLNNAEYKITINHWNEIKRIVEFN
ncbi:46217_t:CDS:2 [Gigaspora margarita]|uniref:46217_t:CDS:1 n=1 Tax=Gigaspora margarita TaxID=4874 RepID=A0ABN7X8A1_GIGMA|nr:46217_t:CDS:2 [Gigaspora margarita]